MYQLIALIALLVSFATTSAWSMSNLKPLCYQGKFIGELGGDCPAFSYNNVNYAVSGPALPNKVLLGPACVCGTIVNVLPSPACLPKQAIRVSYVGKTCPKKNTP